MMRKLKHRQVKKCVQSYEASLCRVNPTSHSRHHVPQNYTSPSTQTTVKSLDSTLRITESLDDLQQRSDMICMLKKIFCCVQSGLQSSKNTVPNASCPDKHQAQESQPEHDPPPIAILPVQLKLQQIKISTLSAKGHEPISDSSVQQLQVTHLIHLSPPPHHHPVISLSTSTMFFPSLFSFKQLLKSHFLHTHP